MPHLTDAKVKDLEPPATGNKVYYDDKVPGFGCRVTAAGARRYILNYTTKAGRERRFTIGEPARSRDDGGWTIGAARIKARELRRLVEDGGDPLGDIEEARSAPTVADLCARFVEELDACFVVRDHNGQQLAYVYFEDEPGRKRRPAIGRAVRNR